MATRDQRTLEDPAVAAAADDAARLAAAVGEVVRGKSDVIELVVLALAASGHALVEDVPGVGKTTLARTLAEASGTSFRRIQFTSDLLPSDILGTSVWDARDATFEFRRGPIFANIVLADEINRATPKTQSALLEAMSDATVSVDGQVHGLPDPFMVIATQNPVDHSGTFPLPDSQLDRFLLRTRMGYPAAADELAILKRPRSARATVARAATDAEGLRRLREAVASVFVHDDLAAWLIRVVAATRTWDAVDVGASPRASLDLLRAAQARALLHGRDHVLPDDVKVLVVPVLAHRLITRDDRAQGPRLETQLRALVEGVPLPL